MSLLNLFGWSKKWKKHRHLHAAQHAEQQENRRKHRQHAAQRAEQLTNRKRHHLHAVLRFGLPAEVCYTGRCRNTVSHQPGTLSALWKLF